MITVVSSASARPNFVKLAAVHHALAKHTDKVRHVIVHTGQHYDPLLSDVFFHQLNIPEPDANLGIKGGASREDVIQATAQAFEKPLEKFKPDVVLVYGDVNGAVGAARAAKKMGIKIGHVEAGLRSGDLEMPEEHNRIEIDSVADFLFCSERSGVDHLIDDKKNRKMKGEIFLVGNTMIDTLIRMKPAIDKIYIGSYPPRFAIVTLHRPSNVDNKEVLKEILNFLREIGTHIHILFPAHKRLLKALEEFSLFNKAGERYSLLHNENVHIRDSLAYIPFLKMIQESQFILTDSGGIQEEAAFLGKRCFTLRRNTERPSTIESGSNVLIDPANASDRAQVLDFAMNPHPKIKVMVPAEWDGKAGDRIADVLLA